MADADHPKTHIEDQENVDLPRTQPESPHREGIDPLTESDTMYPAENTKDVSTKQTKRENSTEHVADNSAQTVADQTALATPGEGNDVVSDSSEDTAEDDARRADSADDNVNADGKLPKDAQIANKVGSDKGNTSPSNKPATVNEPTDPDESASVTADKTTKAKDAKEPAPKADPKVAPTNNYPKSELK